jgi:hypothetical protein
MINIGPDRAWVINPECEWNINLTMTAMKRSTNLV